MVHKRKRSIQDTPIDVSKMRRLMSQLEALREELQGIDEAEAEMAEVIKHVNVLETILKETQKIKISFSDASNSELRNLNVRSGRLVFKKTKVSDLGKEIQTDELANEELKDLRDRLEKIYRRVNMDAGARMVLDAILLSVGEITSQKTVNRDIAIIPGMKARDALFTNAGYQVLLGGTADYGVMEYKKDPDNDNQGRLIGPDTSEEFMFEVAAGQLFLVEAKRPGGLASFIPEAVTQAMTFSSNAKKDTIRFCLSDGIRFIFFILKLKNGIFTYYQSTVKELGRPQDSNFDNELRELIQLFLEWLNPRRGDLFELKDASIGAYQ